MDDGCFLLKLERKYSGKDWLGLYQLMDLIIPNFTTINIIQTIFFIIAVLGIIYGIYTIQYYDWKNLKYN